MKYNSMQEYEIIYKMVSEDQRGMRIEPFLGVSINGSIFIPVQEIISQALSISDLSLKPHRDRVEGTKNWDEFFGGDGK